MVASADQEPDKPAQVIPFLPVSPPQQHLLDLIKETEAELRRITGVDGLVPAWPKSRTWDVILRAHGGGKSYASQLVREYQAKAMPLHHTYEITSVWFDEGEQIERAEQNRIE